MSTATAEALLTAEEYRLLPDNGQRTELVQGRIVPMNMPAPRHGQICSKIDRIVGNYADEHDLGHVVTNDSGVVTRRAPDSVRGADVAFYSYARVPRGPLPEGYLPVAPELAFEVKSPGDAWTEILTKVTEYLLAGVLVVCVLDPQTQTAHVYSADQAPRVFSADEDLVLPEVLGDFRVPVRRFFE
jgi:Uma2 family endonuclease